MASITLAKFRLVTQLSDDVLPREQAIQAMCAGSWAARRITGREFGHSIEFAKQIPATNDVAIEIFGHKLPDSGKVLMGGTGVVALTGVLDYVSIDKDHIKVANVTLATQIACGVVCPQVIAQSRVIEQMAILQPGPVARVIEVRIRRGSMLSGGGPFPDSSIAPTTAWYASTASPSWNGELEVYGNTESFVRRPGMINPVKVRTKREIQAVYYAGCLLGMPDDLETAIASVGSELAKDPSGMFQSENYDYYSYQRMDPEMISKLPMSALATLYSYRRGR